MEFDMKKCHVMKMGKSKKKRGGNIQDGRRKLKGVTWKKDLAATMQDSISRKAHKQGVQRNLQDDAKYKVSFHFMDKLMM